MNAVWHSTVSTLTLRWVMRETLPWKSCGTVRPIEDTSFSNSFNLLKMASTATSYSMNLWFVSWSRAWKTKNSITLLHLKFFSMWNNAGNKPLFGDQFEVVSHSYLVYWILVHWWCPPCVGTSWFVWHPYCLGIPMWLEISPCHPITPGHDPADRIVSWTCPS